MNRCVSAGCPNAPLFHPRRELPENRPTPQLVLVVIMLSCEKLRATVARKMMTERI